MGTGAKQYSHHNLYLYPYGWTVCDDYNIDHHRQPNYHTNFYTGCCDLFRCDTLCSPNHFHERDQRELGAGVKQCRYHNLYLYPYGWTVRYLCNNDHHRQPKCYANLHSGCSDLFRRCLVRFAHYFK